MNILPGQGLIILFFATLYFFFDNEFTILANGVVSKSFGSYLELASSGMALQSTRLAEQLTGTGKFLYVFQSVLGLIWVVVVLGLILQKPPGRGDRSKP